MILAEECIRHEKKTRRRLAGLAALVLLLAQCAGGPAGPAGPAPPTTLSWPIPPTPTPLPHRGGEQRAYPFKMQVVTAKGVTRTIQQGYLLYLPQGYGEDPDARWPLILFLHGVHVRGSSLNLVRQYDIPRIVEERPDFLPFIVLSPQCPDDVQGEDILWLHVTGAVDDLLGTVIETYAVDPDRVYLTGYSMGGYGTWLQATLYPRRFAAIAPVSGGGDPGTVCRIRDVPVWAFHGEEDRIVPLQEAQAMVEALRACGGSVRLTVYPGADHYVDMQTYLNPELYAWLLQHERP